MICVVFRYVFLSGIAGFFGSVGCNGGIGFVRRFFFTQNGIEGFFPGMVAEAGDELFLDGWKSLQEELSEIAESYGVAPGDAVLREEAEDLG